MPLAQLANVDENPGYVSVDGIILTKNAPAVLLTDEQIMRVRLTDAILIVEGDTVFPVTLESVEVVAGGDSEGNVITFHNGYPQWRAAPDLAGDYVQQTQIGVDFPTYDDLNDLAVAISSLGADPGDDIPAFPLMATDFWGISTVLPTLSNRANRMPVWLMQENVDTWIATVLKLPASWTNGLFIDMVWVNTVANAGDASLSASKHDWAIGENINVLPPSGLTTGLSHANPTPNIPVVQTVEFTASDPNKFSTIRLVRNGSSSSDTLENAVAFVVAICRKR